MDLLKKIFGGSPARPEKRYFIFTVKCMRCGEVIEGRVDLDNDLSVEYAEDGESFHARKVLMGENKCFQRIEVELTFSSTRELTSKQVSGGEFLQ
ncbi:MAG: hypothetical protein KA480_17785 [Anaerolineales bacterium]|nr:hypothetical protein [Anaerolineales bacterium]MBP8164122.1 hypothetical protein [Anaerolineales bacterium]